jgi:hypothetical protein
VYKGKGIGAGGANTNFYGKKFEEKTSNQSRVLLTSYANTIANITNNISSTVLCVSSISSISSIVMLSQNELKPYMKQQFNIDTFRNPDEAYIVEYKTGEKAIKILEKKEQRVDGSVETKLWSGPSLKREYELVVGDKLKVHFGFCVNGFLKQKLTSTKKKYSILNTILNENNITILFGDDDDYFEKLDTWLTK